MNVHTPLFIAGKTFPDLRAHDQNHQAQSLLGIHESIFWSFLMHDEMEREPNFPLSLQKMEEVLLTPY